MSSQFKPSGRLLPPKASNVKSVTFVATNSNLDTESIPQEERWWVTRFGLGSVKQRSRHANAKNKALAPKKIQFQSPSNAIISQIVFSKRGPPHQIAIVSGPRVCLYGGSFSSSLSLSLANAHKKKKASLFGDLEDDDDEEDGGVSMDVKADRNIGTGGHPAHCVSYRADGRLVAIGTEDGCVKVCDATSRATLRTFGGSNYAVRAVSWLKGGKKIISAGDDGAIRLWDLSAGIGGVDSDKKPLLSMIGHGDAVRSCVVMSIRRDENDMDATKEKWKEIIVSGSYDHTIRVWDLEQQDDDNGNKCLSVMDHGAPVEALLVLPMKREAGSKTKESPLIVSAGGTTLKIWNPLTGKCLTTVQTKHSKTITSLCLATITKEQPGDDDLHFKRIITGGLDGLIRIHSADDIMTDNTTTTATSETTEKTLKYLHGVNVHQPITALGMSPDQTRFVVGTSSGLILVRQRSRISDAQQLQKKRKRQQPQPGTYAFFHRGANVAPPADDDDSTFKVMQTRKQKLSKYDSYLREFEYGKALDMALESKDPQAVAAILEELGRRKGLVIALSNRDEETLEPILWFTIRYIAKPQYTPVLVGVANLLCDIYRPIIGQSQSIDELFERLRRAVRAECNAQRTLHRIVGQIDAIVWSTEMKRLQEADEQQRV